MRPGDYLLLCSDGLTRMVPDGLLGDAIVRFRDPERIATTWSTPPTPAAAPTTLRSSSLK